VTFLSCADTAARRHLPCELAGAWWTRGSWKRRRGSGRWARIDEIRGILAQMGPESAPAA